jgi:AcrR family transcriptional regulator
MRYSDEHKDAVRRRIIETASRALRLAGLDGVSIPAVMKKAGLTHGGFYGHFSDRDALVAEAVTFASHETGTAVFEQTPSVEAMLETYLSEGHVENPDQGCVVAALGADAPRQRAPVRHAFARAAEGLMALVNRKLHPATSSQTLQDDALALAATMVGAVVLARLVEDPRLARRLLAVARSR